MKNFIPLFEEFENQYNSVRLELSEKESEHPEYDLEDSKLFKAGDTLLDNGIAKNLVKKPNFERPSSANRMRVGQVRSNRQQ